MEDFHCVCPNVVSAELIVPDFSLLMGAPSQAAIIEITQNWVNFLDKIFTWNMVFRNFRASNVQRWKTAKFKRFC